MNPEVKQLWLNALRSGEYQQTKDVLHDREGFCCLGVLTDIYRKEKGGAWVDDDLGYYVFIDVNHRYHETDILPWTVVNWAGLKDQVPHLADNYITNLNDQGMSFKEIANLIEEQF